MKKEPVSIFQDPKGVGANLGCIISGTLKRRRQKCARPPDVRPYFASIVSVHGGTRIMNGGTTPLPPFLFRKIIFIPKRNFSYAYLGVGVL